MDRDGLGQTADRCQTWSGIIREVLIASEEIWPSQPFPCSPPPHLSKAHVRLPDTVAKGSRGHQAPALRVVLLEPAQLPWRSAGVSSAPAQARRGGSRGRQRWAVASAASSHLPPPSPPPLSSWWLIPFLVLTASRHNVAQYALRSPPGCN